MPSLSHDPGPDSFVSEAGHVALGCFSRDVSWCEGRLLGRHGA